jgi:uncharacterized protein
MDGTGAPYQALRKARVIDTLAMSQRVLDELFDVLHRPRLARFVDPVLRADLLDQLVSGTCWFEPSVVVVDCRDPNDNKYLELAVAAEAHTIVSSRHDLLILHPWHGISVLRPADYFA